MTLPGLEQYAKEEGMKVAKAESGVHLFSAMSALQKCIRRGLEEEALYWASEMDRAKFAHQVWSRLRVIASEDIGLADNQMAILIRALYENWGRSPINCGSPTLYLLCVAPLRVALLTTQGS